MLMSQMPSDHVGERHIAIESRLQTEQTVWLSTMRPDGHPHVVPAWFTWDGAVIDVFSKPNAQKVRNVRQHSAVMLAVGQPTVEWDVELVEGTASVLDRPTAEVVHPRLFEKYAELMERAKLDRATFVGTYSQPVRITPTRFIGYGGKGWRDPALSPDGDDEVVGHIRQRDAPVALFAAIVEVLDRRPRDIGLLALEE